MCVGNCEQLEGCRQMAGNEAAGSSGQIVKAESWAKRLTLIYDQRTPICTLRTAHGSVRC